MLPANYIPTDTEVQKYLDAWDNLDDCVSHEVALTLLFTTYPNNSEVSEVLIKCLVLNDFYSAGVRAIDIQKMAENIVSCNIDNRLKKEIGLLLTKFQNAVTEITIHLQQNIAIGTINLIFQFMIVLLMKFYGL